MIRLEDITGLDFRRASPFSPGHLRIVHPGNSTSSFKLRDYDTDTLMFDIADEVAVLPVRALLHARITGTPLADETTATSQSVAAYQFVCALIGIAVLLWLVL